MKSVFVRATKSMASINYICELFFCNSLVAVVVGLGLSGSLFLSITRERERAHLLSGIARKREPERPNPLISEVSVYSSSPSRDVEKALHVFER